MQGLSQQRPASTTAAGVGPRGALCKLDLGSMSERERQVWIEKARLDAILGGVRLSMASLKSGLRCYIAFVG